MSPSTESGFISDSDLIEGSWYVYLIPASEDDFPSTQRPIAGPFGSYTQGVEWTELHPDLGETRIYLILGEGPE